MRLLSQPRYTLGRSFSLCHGTFMLIAMMLVHLALMLMKVEFVHLRRAYFESFYVTGLIFHRSSF